MPVRCKGKEVKTRTPGISYSGMFKKPGSSFPCQKRERERKGHSEEHSSEQVAQGFQGIGRADATRSLESVSNVRTKPQ